MEATLSRFLATVAIAALGTTVVGVGIALAAEIDVTPANPGEGEAELTIEVSEFEPRTPIYAIPCKVPRDTDDLDPATNNCDLSAVTATTTDADGNATIVVTWKIPEEGIAVYVGDEARENHASQILHPGEHETEVHGNEVVEGESPAPDVEVLGTTVVQEELADTGVREVLVLLMVASALIGLGLALRGAERFQTPA